MSRSIFTLVCVALTACTSASSTIDTGARPSSLRSTSESVPLEELRRHTDAASLFDVLQRIRPGMIHPRPGFNSLRGGTDEIDVFVNGQYAGNTETLRSLPPRYVAGVRLMRRSQAYVEYGSWLRGEHVLFVTLLK